MSILTDIKNRGVKDTFFLVCDGLMGLPDVVANLWPMTTVQTCIIHLTRITFEAGLEEGLGRAQTRLCCRFSTAPNALATRVGCEELTERWGKKYGAIVRLWENAWEDFIPFLD